VTGILSDDLRLLRDRSNELVVEQLRERFRDVMSELMWERSRREDDRKGVRPDECKDTYENNRRRDTV
jgi:hypothetical protein